MITEEQKKLLTSYKEKSYINSIGRAIIQLFNFTKNIINIPFILSNSAMVIIMR
jgi:hypothetical protein